MAPPPGSPGRTCAAPPGVREASHGAHGREKAGQARAAAREPVGVTPAAGALAFELASAVGTPQRLDGGIPKVEKGFPGRPRGTSGVRLGTMPGVGPTHAAVIAGEIGDPSRLEGPRRLIAYAGTDPVIKGPGGNAMSHRSILASLFMPFDFDWHLRERFKRSLDF